MKYFQGASWEIGFHWQFSKTILHFQKLPHVKALFLLLWVAIKCTYCRGARFWPCIDHSPSDLCWKQYKITISQAISASWKCFPFIYIKRCTNRVQNRFPYSKINFGTWRSTHVIFTLVKKPLVLVKKDPNRLYGCEELTFISIFRPFWQNDRWNVAINSRYLHSGQEAISFGHFTLESYF